MSGTKRVPGATGIPNNGNTCYLNAVIQCLSNTSQFSDLICREFCRGGEITAQTSALIRTLWLGEPAGKAAQSLIGTVVRLNPQIEFDVQQDAQEFLLWMLTMLHEDLREDKNGLSRRNMARNSFRRIKNLRKKYALAPLPTSPIERFFGGNYCQSIVCPICKKPKQSSELFLTLSLPIPVESKKQAVYPIVHYLSGEIAKIGVRPNIAASVADFRQLVAAEMGIHQRLLAFTEITNTGFGPSFGDNDDVNSLPLEGLRIFQIPAAPSTGRNGQNTSSASTTRWESCILLIILKSDGYVKPDPLVMRMARDATARELHTEIFARLNQKYSPRQSPRLKVSHHDGSEEMIDSSLEHPLLTSALTTAMKTCPTGSPIHIRIIAEFPQDAVHMIEDSSSRRIKEEPSVRLTEIFDQQQSELTLSECLDLHMKEEEIVNNGLLFKSSNSYFLKVGCVNTVKRNRKSSRNECNFLLYQMFLLFNSSVLKQLRVNAQRKRSF